MLTISIIIFFYYNKKIGIDNRSFHIYIFLSLFLLFNIIILILYLKTMVLMFKFILKLIMCEINFMQD